MSDAVGNVVVEHLLFIIRTSHYRIVNSNT